MDLETLRQLYEEERRKHLRDWVDDMEVLSQEAIAGNADSIAKLKNLFAAHLADGRSVAELPGLLTHVAVLAYCNGDGAIHDEVKRLSALQRAVVDGPIGRREEATYLNIIGGLLALMLGRTPSGIAQSVYANQSAIIDALLGHYPGKPGLSARTLEDKFAAAKRSLTAT